MNESIVSYKYTGWIYEVLDGKYGIDIKCKTVKDESGLKFAQHIMFSVSNKSKNYETINLLDLMKGDKVEVEFIPNLQEGVSKTTQKAYAIGKNNMTSVKVLEKVTPEEAAADEPDPADIPF